MNAAAEQELQGIKDSLRGVIRDLQEISRGVRYGFTGIGNDLCANCIDRVIEKYQGVLTKLNNMKIPDNPGNTGCLVK